ncbi:recombinase RecT [Methylocystis sp. S23]
MNDVVTLDQARPRPAIVAGHKPQAIVPTDFDSCWRLAIAICASGITPQGIDTPEKAMVALMHGLEIGLPPMAAMQRIAVVNGRPTIWGDAAMGLVRASGLCEYVSETVDGEGDARVAICEAKRKGDPKPVARQFSVADAKRAGLWSPEAKVTRYKKDGGTYQKENDSPWHRYPDRMLQMRARAFCLRDLFADVLGGLYLREEIDDEARPAEARTEPPPPPPPAVAQIETKAIEPPPPAAAKEPAPPPGASAKEPAPLLLLRPRRRPRATSAR